MKKLRAIWLGCVSPVALISAEVYGIHYRRVAEAMAGAGA